MKEMLMLKHITAKPAGKKWWLTPNQLSQLQLSLTWVSSRKQGDRGIGSIPTATSAKPTYGTEV